MKILLLGKDGYVGKKFVSFLKDEEVNVSSFSRKDFNFLDKDILNKIIKSNKPDFIINCAGYTGKPNVDACETNKESCWLGNVTLPKTISEIANNYKIKYIQVSSGCIYSGDNSGKGFTEKDMPNFCFDKQPSSYYSGTKAVAEDILKNDKYAYLCRLRIPFNHEQDDKNYITKMLKYNKLLNAKNSLSNIDDFIRGCFYLIDKGCNTGIYNITNTGHVTTKEVVNILNKYITDKKFTFFKDEKEFYSTAAITPRSNCILNNQKILQTGFKMLNVKDSIIKAVKNYGK